MILCALKSTQIKFILCDVIFSRLNLTFFNKFVKNPVLLFFHRLKRHSMVSKNVCRLDLFVFLAKTERKHFNFLSDIIFVSGLLSEFLVARMRPPPQMWIGAANAQDFLIGKIGLKDWRRQRNQGASLLRVNEWYLENQWLISQKYPLSIQLFLDPEIS